MVNVATLYERPEEQATHETWATNFAAALRQSDSGVYVNFLGDEGKKRIRAAYPGGTWDRLRAIKAQYDPTNFFKLNQNIPPK
jgi:FAD/FMN-containing dehydrogenase